MSGVVISYGDGWGTGLKEASKEAKTVSRRLADYADALNDEVYKKLNNYAGDRNENFNSALNSIRAKITQLEEDSDKYETYSADIDDLKETCKQVDQTVAARVESLTEEFKEANGITTSKFLDNIDLFLTNVKNRTFIGRWLDDAKDWFGQTRDYLKECIEDWYQFQGGEQFVKGTVVAALELVAAVASVGAAIAGVATIGMVAAVAGAIGGILAGANAIANLVNEGRALAKYGDDPAKAQRLSEENSLQDTLRKEGSKNIALLDGLAGALDAVSIACAVVGFVSGAKEMSDGLKSWAGEQGIWSKIKTSVTSGKNELKDAFANKKFNNIKTALKNNIVGNLTDNYLNTDSVKDTFSTIGNWADLSKNAFTDVTDLASGDFGFANVGEMFKTAASNITPIEYEKLNKDGTVKIGIDGKPEIGSISVSDMTGFVTDQISIVKDTISFFSSASSTKIAVPQSILPDVHVDVQIDPIKIDLSGLRASLSY